MANLETGVDRLLELIELEKRVSIDDAAKKLGVSKVVVQEWADFLEEEKIISIEYKFSKTYLVVRVLSDKEIKVKEKEYSSEKDAFVRKVEASLKNLENDSLGFEKIKKEFESLKKDLGSELTKVESEVKELEKYEYLKKNLDTEIQKQVDDFHKVINQAHKEIDIEEKKQQELMQSLEIEKREVSLKEHRLKSLEEKEEELTERLQGILDVSKELQKKILEEKVSISESEKKALNLENYVGEIEKNIFRRKKDMQPLLDKSKAHEEQIMKIQDEILQKVKQKSTAIKTQVAESLKAKSNLQSFFEKKANVENLIGQIEKEKLEMEESFRKLEKKAIAFNVSSKTDTVTSHVKGLEKDYTSITKKRNKLKEDLLKLTKLIKG
jgi:chromosome segregation ATPase